MLISQFKFKENKRVKITSENYDKAFYKNLNFYSKKNKMKIHILSVSRYYSEMEKKFYNKVIGNNKYYFIKRHNQSSSYINSLNNNFFVCHTSTLGFELLARGKRVVFLYEFEKIKKSKSFRQSFWDDKFSGKFWSNTKNYENFEKKLNYTFYVKIREHSKFINDIVNPFVIYNKNNSIFKNLLKKLNTNNLQV